MFNTNLLATLFAFVLAVVSLQGMQAESVCEHYTVAKAEQEASTLATAVMRNSGSATTNYGGIVKPTPAPVAPTVEKEASKSEKEASKLEKAIMRQTGTASFQGLRSLKSKYLDGADMLRGSLKIQPLVRCEMNYLPVRETDVVKGYFQ